jgi:hypothetical protein
VDTGINGVDDGVVKELEVRLCGPVVFDGLEFATILAGSFSGDHEVVQRLEVGIGGAKDVGVVAGIDGCGDESCGFGVSSCNGEEISACIYVSVFICLVLGAFAYP